MPSMDLVEALRVLGLSDDNDDVATRQSVRRAYLRRALEVHPDASSRRGAGRASSSDEASSDDTASFQRLREAYEVALGHLEGRGGGEDGDGIGAEDDVLMRAWRGEDVRASLARRGGWRPGEAFGVDFGVRWMGDGADFAGDDEGWREVLEAGLAVEEDGDDRVSE